MLLSICPCDDFDISFKHFIWQTSKISWGYCFSDNNFEVVDVKYIVFNVIVDPKKHLFVRTAFDNNNKIKNLCGVE